jgi:Tol biopolymer transport system component
VYTKAPPQQKIWTMALQGPSSKLRVEARELTVGTSIHGTPDISPDGKAVTFARNDGGAGNIYVTPFERYAPQALTNSAADEWSPRWSPDGGSIAFTTRDSAMPGVLILEIGTGQIRRISTDAVAPLGSIAWSPDGRHVLFPLDLGRHYAFVNVATASADTLRAPDSVAGFRQTVFSSDGKDIAVNVWPWGKDNQLWRGKTSGKDWIRLDAPQHVGSAPLLWTRDGWIYSLAGDNTLWRVPVAGGAAQRLLELPQPCSDWEIALSANARRLVCTVSMSESDIWTAENFDPEAH